MDVNALYTEGRIDDAIAALNQQVKAAPTDVDARGMLVEFLCIQGNLERADRLLEALRVQDPSVAVGVSLLQQLVRAALCRKEFWEAGRVPAFLGEPSDHERERMRASILLREGAQDEATTVLRAAEEARPHPKGTAAGAAFDDLRDLDDVLGGVLEVFTSTGKYYWIPIERVVRMEARSPERPIDVLWLPVEMTVADGPDGVVYVPTTYHGALEQDDVLKLGRATEWLGEDDGVVRGAGLRTFLVGEEAKTVFELGELLFEHDA